MLIVAEYNLRNHQPPINSGLRKSANKFSTSASLINPTTTIIYIWATGDSVNCRQRDNNFQHKISGIITESGGTTPGHFLSIQNYYYSFTTTQIGQNRLLFRKNHWPLCE